MKKLLTIVLSTLLLISCNEAVIISTVDLENNITACLEYLKTDTYIKACDDIKTETINYFKLIEENDQEIDYSIYDALLTDLLIVGDVSQNQDLKLNVNRLYNDIMQLIAPKLKKHEINNYKYVADKKPFKNLKNDIIANTSLKYQDTFKQRLTYDNEQLVYKTTFTDENMVSLDYYTDEAGSIDYIQLSSDNDDQNLYLNFARLYTFEIIMSSKNVTIDVAHHDALLVERKLQFFNDDQFLNTAFEITINDKIVIIKPLNQN